MDKRFRCIVTEGIFSMDGDILELPKYIALAKKYKAIFYLDECHSTGVLGKTGRGSVEYWGANPDDVDLISSTLGKAVSGGGGGYTTGKKNLIEYLRQTSKTFIFSNSLCSPIIGASREALRILKADTSIFEKIRIKGLRFRKGMEKEGFKVYGDYDCPICPVCLYDEYVGKQFEIKLFEKGYYTIGIGFPIFPQGTARIRIIITAIHTNEQIDGLIQAFVKIAEELNYFEIMKDYDLKVQKGLVIGHPNWWRTPAKL